MNSQDRRQDVPRCTVCFKIIDVKPANDIFLQDEGVRDGHYYARYAHEFARMRCARCRHRIAAMERLVSMWIRRGDDVHWLDDNTRNAEEDMVDNDDAPLVVVGYNLDTMARALGIANGGELFRLMHVALTPELKRTIRQYCKDNPPDAHVTKPVRGAPLSDERLAEIRATFEAVENARQLLTELGGPEWSADRPRGPMVEAVRDLLADSEFMRARDAALMSVVSKVAECGVESNTVCSWLLFVGEEAEAIRELARTLTGE